MTTRTTTHLKLAAKKLDSPAVIMGIVVCVFALAGLVAAAGRYTPSPAADPRPVILVQTATPAAPIYVDRVVERVIIATPTAAPEPAAVIERELVPMGTNSDAQPAQQPEDPLPSVDNWPADWRTRGQPSEALQQ